MLPFNLWHALVNTVVKHKTCIDYGDLLDKLNANYSRFVHNELVNCFSVQALIQELLLWTSGFDPRVVHDGCDGGIKA